MTQQQHVTVKERFLLDVARHEMKIELDQPPHRSIVFKRPDSSTYLFRLTTWPGALCINGDMHTYVFERLRDMFEFFRSPDGEISLGYWAKKITATERRGGHEEFDGQVFLEYVRYLLKENTPKQDRADLYRAAKRAAEEGYHASMLFLHDGDDALGFDNEPPRCTKPTFGFEWCCHAIVWGINRYDAHHANAVKEAA